MANGDPVILVVDDDVEITDFMASVFRAVNFNTVAAHDAPSAFRKIRSCNPELLFLDVNLPNFDGCNVCREVKKDIETTGLPVIMVTADKELETIRRCYESGTDDFINKPFSSSELISKVKSLLRIKSLERQLKATNDNVQMIISADNKKEFAYLNTIKSLARMAEAKDRFGYFHASRVTKYAIDIAVELGLSGDELLLIKEAAELHDIGKIAISENVLSKKNKLTEDEWNLIKKHPETGSKILKQFSFHSDTVDAIKQHHERFDGKGYPTGNSGKAIPLAARIIAVADAYEAMTNDRPYRPALPNNKIVEQLRENASKQFDPLVVEAFLKTLEKQP